MEGVVNLEIDSSGNKRWFLKGRLHREDGPAVETVHGDRIWYYKGRRHRKDGPACEYSNGDREWWINGKRHRTDGPAIIEEDGDKYWYLFNELHREDGPAIELRNEIYWYLNGIYYYSQEKYEEKLYELRCEKWKIL